MAKAKNIKGLDAQAPVIENARIIARTRLDELYDWDRYIDEPYRIRELHNLRIAAKRLRYTFEVFEDVFPEQCQAFVDELTQIQDQLGALHDSDVMIALLRLCLAGQDSVTQQQLQADNGQSGEKPLVARELVAHLLDAAVTPNAQERYGLEVFLKEQEREREQQYQQFRQHWYQLKTRDFRREMLAVLDAIS